MNYNDFKKLSPDAAIAAAASYSGFTPDDIRGVWRTESDEGQNKGPSSAGALGDFQIYPKTQQSLEQRFGRKFDASDFHDSLFMASEVLRENLGHFGNKVDALKAYNGGWDKSTWGNPETAAYAGKVLGTSGDPVVDTFMATQGMPAFTKNASRFKALDDSGLDAPLFQETGTPTPEFTALNGPAEDARGMYDEDARRLAFEGQHAGFSEVAIDSMTHNTVTGALTRWMEQGAPDPSFNAGSDENRQAIQRAGLLGNDQLTDYVLGAVNAEDFRHKLADAQERSDLFRRMANTDGWTPTLASIIGGLADPVGVVASMGAGSMAAVARSTAAAGRMARLARGAAGGAAENIAMGEYINATDNQRFQWSNVFSDALMGGALGALGGLMHTPEGRLAVDPDVHVAEDFKPVMDRAAANVHEAVNNIAGREYEFGLTKDTSGPVEDPTISTDAADMPSIDLGTGPTPWYRRIEPEAGPVRYEVKLPEQYLPPDAYNAKLGYKPTATLDDPTYKAMHDAGIITELRSAKDLPEVSDYQRRLGQEVPDDAKAVYIPQDDRVYVFRDRLTPKDVNEPIGLVMHEVGVHYGLERAIGTENYQRVLGDLSKSEDARVQEAMKAVPGDTPEHLRLEEALGYLVEKYPTLGVVQSVVAKLRNWLRENVPVFRGLAVSADDAVAYVKGSLEHVRREGLAAADQEPIAAAGGARYSRSGDAQPAERYNGFDLETREQAIADHLNTINANLDPEHVKQIERTQAMLAHLPAGLKKGQEWAMSPGVSLSTSPSAHARQAGAMLFENSLGSAGRPKDGTVAMDYERLHAGYRDPYLQRAHPLIRSLMTTGEKLADMMGSRKAMDRISDLVAEERAKRRQAFLAGGKHESTAPEAVQKLAGILDEQMYRMAKEGKEAGTEYGDAVWGSGTTGFMPQVWDWVKFTNAREDGTTWKALWKNFTQQYMEKNVAPVLAQMEADGVDAAAVARMREHLSSQVEHQVQHRMLEAVRNPDSRTDMDTTKFESLASQLLDEQFKGLPVNDDLVSSFRDKLAELRTDRSRTEFDLLRQVDGVRLLDYVEHDLPTLITGNAHRFAGQTAMAKHGFRSYADFEALVTLLHKDGARAVDINNVMFAGRAFGFGKMIAKDHPLLGALRNFTHLAMMGKLGVAQFADLTNTITALGMSQLPRLLGKGLQKETEMYKQAVEMFGNGLTGTDYRIQRYTADAKPNGRAMGGYGERMLRMSQRGVNALGWVSGAHAVNYTLHKAFLPIMAENLVRAARGLDGGMPKARLADAGLSAEGLARIRAQLDKYEPHRKEGDRFQWESWDDQWAADRLIDAMHRITDQVFQRAHIGEAPMWRSESAIGSIMGQFHGYGLGSMEKQLGRNLAINDSNTWAAMSIGLAWASLLYYGRVQMNTTGMSAEKAREYVEKNMSGAALAQGVLTYFNMSGIAAEVVGVGKVLFGGNSNLAAPEAAAALSYWGNLTKAATAGVDLVKGAEKPKQDWAKILRILPGGNTVLGTHMLNTLREGN